MGKKQARRETIGFLGRLRRDMRGNTLAFMAALLIPLVALSGSAVDVARLYAVKTRLQQACDAGVLAGRKTMSDAGDLDTSDTGAAQSFFKNNFQNGWFKTNSVSFTPTKTSENQVSGTATATVPMAIMGMFGMAARTISVTCEARYDVADADIVFVLDTTGSMACLTSDSISTCDSYAINNVHQDANGYYTTEKANSRIAGLRSAVSGFYTTLTSQADPTTHFRFGFVPYSATVNVGHLLPNSYLATTWNYQSRWHQAGAADSVSTSTGSATSMTQAACDALAVNPVGYDATDTKVVKTPSYNNATGKCTVTMTTYHMTFRYGQALNVDVSAYTQFQAVDNPAQPNGPKSTWLGCVEERNPGGAVVANPSASNPPPDLDVDTVPSGATSQWGPLWPEIEYWRSSSGTEDSAAVRTPLTRSGGETAGSYHEVPCPKQAQRLATMSASDITDYLSASNGFRPYGVTYHDYGMTWGTRLLSPNGIFKNDTAAWSGHNPPNRYIVFLTDGAMQTDVLAYTSHGMEQFDKRAAGNTPANLTTNHNNRFTTACTIAKNHNITIFVIAYAQTMTTELQNCASPGQAYYASNTAALNTAFSAIAKQVAMLRISK
ncbi:MAG: pilus assembly protein [Sphingomonas sp.]|nr:pilus assembly protein [Sphingomonas sp.]